jgi:CHASE2 domain-containing sensor protein
MRHGYLSFTDQAGSRRKSLAARAAEALEGSSSKLPPQTTKIWLDPSVDPLQFQKLSWKDLDNTLDHQPSLFRDRLVIFGGEFAASGDDHRIPARPLQPALISGLVLQSMMVDTIVRGEFITDLAQSTTLAIAALISALVAFGALCWKKLKYANLVLAGGVVVWAFFCFFLFLSNRIMVQMVPALITIVIAGIMGLIIRLRLRRFPSPGQII